MVKESSFTLRICDWVTKYSIYTAIFLTPIFFLPWTSDVLDFNKQALLLLLVMVSFFAWMLKVLVSGKVEINKNRIHIVVGILFLSYIFSTIFSVYRYGSFWGWPQITSEGLLSIMAIFLFYFLIVNIFSKNNIFTSVIVLFSSALIVELIGILQLLKLFIFPLDFTKSVIFNTVGTIGSLGFFVAILLPLAMILLMASKNWWKVLFIFQLVLSAVILFLINYPIIWWAVILGSALVMIFGVFKKEFFDARWLALPMFFLAISLFFMLLSGQVNWLPRGTNEISLSHGATFQITLQAVKENPIFGSGPGTFAYDFLKFKNPDFNKSSLWNITLNRGSSKILDNLVTTGLLGFLAFLAVIIYPVILGIKFLISKKSAKVLEHSVSSWVLTSGFLIAFAAQVFAYFLYNSNIVLELVFFFLIAGLVVSISEEKTRYELKSSSLLTLLFTFIFTLVFIFGLGLLILDGQRYVAEVSYFKGLLALQSNNLDDGIINLEKAASQNSSSDLYFRQLSRVYLFKLQDELSKGSQNPSEEEKNKIQILAANSVNAGKIATDINPNNANNWSVRGYVYQSLMNVGQQEAETWALTSYQEALKLDPNNPYLLMQEANVNFVLALRMGQDQIEQKNQFLNQAKEKLEKAVDLNPNYSDVLYSLGLVYDSLGEKEKAIEKFTLVQQLNPQNNDIAKILESLKAGRSAIQTATPPSATPLSENPPDENASSENTVKNPPDEGSSSEITNE